jgi:hypothetical protein
MSIRPPPPVPPRRKVPVGLTLNDYRSKATEECDGEGHDTDLFNNQMGGGGGLKAARQISSTGLLASQSDPHLSSLILRDSFNTAPESTIGAGVEIKGTMQFKRCCKILNCVFFISQLSWIFCMDL